MRALALAAVIACGPPRLVGQQPSWRKPSPPTVVAPVTFAPSSAAASEYNARGELPPHSALGDAVMVEVDKAAAERHLTPPVADPRLFRACEELAEIVPESGMIDYDLEAFALQRNGIIEPSPHMVTVWGDVGVPGPMIDQLRPLLGDMLAEGATAVGIGAARRRPDGSGVVVFAMQPSSIHTAPIPRSVAAGGAFAIDATIDAKYHDPEVFVTRDDGSVERIPVEPHGAAFKTRVPCDRHRGKQQLEITATGAQGSTVLANFPVWCGAEPPRSMTIDVTADDGAPVTPDDAERRLLALANRDRAAAGLPGLIWDDRIAAVARKYSEEMRTTKIVAHVSAISGSVVDRLKAAGITSSVVLENVARDYSVVGAHEGLMNSPGHRANLLSATATHIGIGVAYGDEVAGRREMFLTQVFIRIPPKVDPGRASDLVRQRIEAVRRVGVDPTLSAIAQTVADGLASGKSRDDLWPAARKRLDAGPGDYARVGSAVLAVADLDSVDAKDLLSGYKPDAIGIGIAQGNHPEIGEGAIWIVVLMAERPTKP